MRCEALHCVSVETLFHPAETAWIWIEAYFPADPYNSAYRLLRIHQRRIIQTDATGVVRHKPEQTMLIGYIPSAISRTVTVSDLQS